MEITQEWKDKADEELYSIEREIVKLQKKLSKFSDVWEHNLKTGERLNKVFYSLKHAELDMMEAREEYARC